MRWFPFSSFQVPAIALYLSDHSLAVLRLDKEKRVISFAHADLPSGVVLDGKVLDKDKLALAIRELCKNALPVPVILTEEIPVILSIPESQSFTHLFTVPTATLPEKFKDVVFAKARELIPMDMAHLYWDWHIAERNVGAIDRVLFAAAPREIVDAYISVCTSCNLLPLAIDMETTSLARALLLPDGKTSVIMDIGARTTNLGFFDEEQRLGLSVSISIAGNSFTSAIVDRMHSSWEVSEALKREQGLNRAIPDNRVLIIIQERLQAIMHDFVKAMTYYESTYRKPVTRVVLAGGSALLPDIVTYYAMNLKREVVLGEPFRLLGGMNPELAEVGEPIRFAPVVGLALRAIAPHPESAGINLLHGWEGERWEEREGKILKKWRQLALPLFVASIVLLLAVSYVYIYRPYTRLHAENISRINLLPTATEIDTERESTTTPDISPISTETSTTSTATTTETVLPTAVATTTPAKTTIRIKETPTGYLNVRREPASTGVAFTKVYPKETYPLITLRGEWMEIALSGSTSGWVSARYAEEIPLNQ